MGSRLRLPCLHSGPSRGVRVFKGSALGPSSAGALFSSSRPSVCVRVCVTVMHCPLHVFKWYELFWVKKCTQMRRFYTPDKLVHFLYKKNVGFSSRDSREHCLCLRKSCRARLRQAGFTALTLRLARPVRPRTASGGAECAGGVGSWRRGQLFIAFTIGLLRIPPHGLRRETKVPMTPL